MVGFIPFLEVLAQCEMQTALFRVWTRIAETISYDNNHYTMITSKLLYTHTHTCFYDTLLPNVCVWVTQVKREIVFNSSIWIYIDNLNHFFLFTILLLPTPFLPPPPSYLTSPCVCVYVCMSLSLFLSLSKTLLV